MNDPHRFPKVQKRIEQEMKDSYALESNKMIVDFTKQITKFKK